MAHEPAWGRTAAAKAPAKGASSIACFLFVAAMGAAFWMGALWASQSWLGVGP
jgi:hypothetical protein